MAVPTIRDGQVATKGARAINQDQPVVDMLDHIYTLDPESNPALTVLTARAQVKKAESFEIKHLEDQPIPEQDLVNGAQTNVETTIEVDNGPYHRAGDVILNPRTGELIRVTAVATNDLTVTRGYGGTTAAAMNDNDNLLNLGTPEEEGARGPAAKNTVVVTKSNYTEILKTSVHVSRTVEQTSLYGMEERARQRARKGAEHARDWEQKLFHGIKSEDTTTGSAPIRMTGGIDQHIVTNILDAGGAMTESTFLDFLGDVFRYKVDGGSGSRAMFSSREVINTINTWGTGKLETVAGGSKLGFKVTTYATPYGDLDVVNHPLLETAYAGYAYIVDMAGILIRPLQPTVLQTDIQENDEDGHRDQYLTEQGFSFMNEEAFGLIKGVTFS